MQRYSKKDIEKVLPFRDPFLLIDEVFVPKSQKKIIAKKRITGNEWFLKGHFPNNPIMPGHMIAEAMAQTCSLVFMAKYREKLRGKLFFLAASRTRFLRPVRPKATLTITAYPVKILLIAGVARAEVHVGKKLVATGEFSVALR